MCICCSLQMHIEKIYSIRVRCTRTTYIYIMNTCTSSRQSFNHSINTHTCINTKCNASELMKNEEESITDDWKTVRSIRNMNNWHTRQLRVVREHGKLQNSPSSSVFQCIKLANGGNVASFSRAANSLCGKYIDTCKLSIVTISGNCVHTHQYNS